MADSTASSPSCIDLDRIRAERGLPNTVAFIDPAAMARNIRALKNRIPSETALSILVKSDGYGHGMSTIARVALRAGCRFLLVASLDEAIRLRRICPDAEILQIGPIFPEEAREIVRSNIAVALGSLEIAGALDQAARAEGRRARVHLKIDTGMGRFGFLGDPAQFDPALDEMRNLAGLEVEGLMTHFSEADEPESPFTLEQARLFQSAWDMVRRKGFDPRWIHAANSGAVAYFSHLAFSMVRVGIAAYGAYPGSAPAKGLELEPAMTFLSRVSDLREVPAGTPVSYGRTFVTQRPSRLALIPVGYGHGYPRHASGKAQVMIQGRRAPVVGRITMNLVVVDATELEKVAIGDPVLLFGRLGRHLLRVEELAGAAQTIAYEILCNVGRSAPRHVLETI